LKDKKYEKTAVLEIKNPFQPQDIAAAAEIIRRKLWYE